MALVGEMKNLTIGNKTYHIPIPTKTSDLQNDSNFMSGMTILSYGTSTWNDFLTAYKANHVVYCRASSNANPASGSQTRMAFMAYVSDATNPTNVEFQYYRSVSSHTSSQQGDQVYVYKLTSANAWTVTVREASVKVAVTSPIAGSYNSGTYTISIANAYGDTKNPYGTKTANYVLAGPTSGSAAAPSFRALVASDIPDLSSIYLTSFTETDPTVPSWAKASSKPSYNFSEIGNTPTTISGYGITDALTIGTTATTAAAGNHTHTTSLAIDTGTSTVTLASAGKYKLTAGGTSVIFTMPTIPTINYPVTSVNTKTGDVTLSASDVGAAASSHSHGYLKNDGTFSSQMPIANGDYLVVADHSNSDKLCYTTLAFDGSTTTKALTQKGTWETFLQTEQYTGTVTGVKINGTTKNPSSGIVDIGTVATSDTDTTYSLSNALSSHKFTWTFTAGGSGSGSTTTTAELAAGTGISLTDDTTNKKITIASTVTNTDEKVKLTSNTGSTAIPIVLGPTSITSGTAYNCLYNTNLKYTPSTGNLQTTQLNGVAVGSTPKFTDTVTTVTSSGSGNVVTGMSASNGAITYTMGSAALIGTYNSTSKNLTLSVTTS